MRWPVLNTAAIMSAAPRTLRRLRALTGLPLRGPMPASDVDLSRVDLFRLAAEVISVYAANLRLVRLLAREYRFRPMFFWQPVITTKRFRTPDEQRWENDYTTDPSRRRTLYEAIIAERRSRPELAGALDTFDLSALFDEHREPVYI